VQQLDENEEKNKNDMDEDMDGQQAQQEQYQGLEEQQVVDQENMFNPMIYENQQQPIQFEGNPVQVLNFGDLTPNTRNRLLNEQQMAGFDIHVSGDQLQ